MSAQEEMAVAAEALLTTCVGEDRAAVAETGEVNTADDVLLLFCWSIAHLVDDG
jgi:hypothetical protein